jgi:hypothetical protein
MVGVGGSSPLSSRFAFLLFRFTVCPPVLQFDFAFPQKR